MLKNIVNYVRNNEFYINIWKNKINVVNFKEIIIMEEDKIVIMADLGKVIIRGQNLSINKLLDNEILIMGVFSLIELGE